MTSIPYLQRKYKISFIEAKKRLEASGEKAPDVYIHDESLTKDQRYYRRHKQMKEKKPRVYHFQKYWKEEWEKTTNLSTSGC